MKLSVPLDCSEWVGARLCVWSVTCLCQRWVDVWIFDPFSKKVKCRLRLKWFLTCWDMHMTETNLSLTPTHPLYRPQPANSWKPRQTPYLLSGSSLWWIFKNPLCRYLKSFKVINTLCCSLWSWVSVGILKAELVSSYFFLLLPKQNDWLLHNSVLVFMLSSNEFKFTISLKQFAVKSAFSMWKYFVVD